MTTEHIVKTLKEAGLPPAPDTPIDAQYRMGSDDWYVKTARGWYWCDIRSHTRTWKFCPTGPS